MKDILARNILLLGALDEISAAAAQKNLRLILLKGAALLAEGVYGPGEREMTDVDILVRPRDEKAFDALLAGLGFKPMENSSQAYCRPAGPSTSLRAGSSAPPVIVDLHTGLWHEKETEALWHRSARVSQGMSVPALGLEDQLLHLASHTLLYHGCLGPRTLEDLARLVKFVYRKTDRADFWRRACDIAADEKLKPALIPVFTRFAAAHPELMSEKELAAFEPPGTEKLKSRFFEKAAVRHSRLLEYVLPGLYRPWLFVRYLFPGKTFLEKRYGRASWTNHFIRPFQLIAAILRKED
ncbi:MAG: nucleotidyltransferase family protein [Elusimicrobia bacterium]|nr:nucleotidyltransferase family protein [Elusimicrobiota bacterium]